ncbi:MAG: dipeptidase [Micrococcus sp.]|nr:dipeptidase [Micrococcus sp.]
MTSDSVRVAPVLDQVLRDLRGLIEIPSVSSMPEHDEDVLTCAAEVERLLREIGCPEVRQLEAGGKPAVYGHFPAPEGAPTVLLYAHYDVQPTGALDAWTTPPFEPTERNGRLYARGAADDKGGLAVHLAALRAFNGQPPVGVKVLVEGEEEIGSPTMLAMIEKYPDEFTADAHVITDAMNWQTGQPSLTTSLRGNVDAVVRVSTSGSGLHSGGFGGAVPDALTALCRLLATLHDDAGNVAIEGLVQREAPDLEYGEQRLRDEADLLEGVQLLGEGSVVQRLWMKPTASVLAIDTTRIADASNTLIPQASAKVSVRLAPGQDVAAATNALHTHLRENAPWGAHVEIEAGRASAASEISMDSTHAQAAVDALTEAFGVAPVEVGIGGSIPIVAAFAERFPESTVLVTAVVDPHSRMHSNDESMDLGDFAKACQAEALFLQRLGRDAGAAREAASS